MRTGKKHGHGCAIRHAASAPWTSGIKSRTQGARGNLLHIDALEAIWLFTNLGALILTLRGLADAWSDLRATRTDDGPGLAARALTARGNVRREILRVIVQGLLLSLVIPGLTTDHEIPLSPAIAVLLAIPMVLLLSSTLDARERGTLTILLTLIPISALDEMTALAREGIALNRVGIDKADRAYHEANSANTKIADLTEIVGGKVDKEPNGG